MTNTIITYRDQWGRPDARELTDDEEELLDEAFNYFYEDKYYCPMKLVSVSQRAALNYQILKANGSYS